MKTNPREILIYYHPQSSSGKKTIAHAKSISQHVKTFAFDNNPSTNTSWRMILNSLDIEPKQLLDKSHPDYQRNIRGKEFDNEGWLDVIQRNPHLIKAAIAIKGKEAVFCINPTDVYKLKRS